MNKLQITELLILVKIDKSTLKYGDGKEFWVLCGHLQVEDSTRFSFSSSHLFNLSITRMADKLKKLNNLTTGKAEDMVSSPVKYFFLDLANFLVALEF